MVVNGQLVFDGDRMTGARPGRVLRGPAFVTSRSLKLPGPAATTPRHAVPLYEEGRESTGDA